MQDSPLKVKYEGLANGKCEQLCTIIFFNPLCCEFQCKVALKLSNVNENKSGDNNG